MKFAQTIAAATALGAMLLPGMAAAQSAQDGAAIFKQQCQMCHVSSKDAKPTLAPNLFGVGGRKAASSGFASYSPALKASGLVWNKANLDRFLTAPTKAVPGTRMVIAIPDAKRRQAVIDYLQTLK
ncbi:c-type cytochrome [Novosphingobium rosa]|uniref:c-type cytochrome n=1 Tax=Novosphingobium rosa TaxID=76978 RepID=UPI00082E1D36|nr:c-type cytochrome [Novosphingobium rosa]